MKKFNTLALSAALILLISTACNSSEKIDVTGNWTRPVADKEMGIIGYEYLHLKEDSVLHIVNELTMIHQDSIFDCSIKFTTSVSGKWSMENGAISLFYDATTFRLDTIANNVKLSARKTEMSDSITKHMKIDIITGLEDYYRSIYESLQSNGPLVLDQVVVSNDTLGASTDGFHIEWTR